MVRRSQKFITELPEDIYGSRIIFIICDTKLLLPELEKRYPDVEFDEWYTKELHGRAFTIENKNGTRHNWIWVPPYTSDVISIATLSHECLHAACDILNDRGVKFHRKFSEEAYTYYHKWIFSHCLRATNAYMRRRR